LLPYLLMKAISSYAACTNFQCTIWSCHIYHPICSDESPSPNHAIILQHNWSDRKGENQESGCLATVQTALSAHWDNAREIRWPGSSECRMKAPWKYSVIPATLDSTYIMRLLMEVNTKSAWLCRGYRNMSLCSAPGRSSRRYPRCSCGRVAWENAIGRTAGGPFSLA